MHISHQAQKGSFKKSFFHVLGEVELVFGLWAVIFFLFLMTFVGPTEAKRQFLARDFTEPMFVFVIMVIASSRPVLFFAKSLINTISDGLIFLFPIHNTVADFLTVLVVGPLLGSVITEPAAITVSALLINSMLQAPSQKFFYGMLAVLFVNVSIGGALTHFAAPPILMVAGKWQWDLSFIFQHFGIKSVLAVVLNASILSWLFRQELQQQCLPLDRIGFGPQDSTEKDSAVPFWLIAVHVTLLIFVVLQAHSPYIFFGLLLLFLGFVMMTKKHQTPLRFRESSLVALFLAGIIVFGDPQKWWLQSLLSQMTDGILFLGAVTLTAVTDNAALTYLGTQVDGLSKGSQFSLVAGALVGGGLTIIANAPNAVGYSVLQNKFDQDGLDPLALFKAALLPTLIAGVCYWFLPF